MECKQGRKRPFPPPVSSRLIDIMTLTRVCSRWRSVLVSDSRLWSNIYCDTRLSTHDLIRWLTISSDVHLNLTLDTTLGRRDHYKTVPACKKTHTTIRNSSFLPCVLPVLARFISRIKSLTIFSICSSETSVIMDFLETIPSADNIRYLSITSYHSDCAPFLFSDGSAQLIRPRLPFHGVHPKLERIQMHNVPAAWFHPHHISLITSLYTSYFECSIDVPSATGVLRHGNNIKSLSIGPYWPTLDIAPMEISTLTRLDVEFSNAESTSAFFRNISLPNLLTLTLRLNFPNADSCLTHAFGRRANGETPLHGVSTLVLRKIKAKQRALENFLSSLPNLQHIVFPHGSTATYRPIIQRLLTNADRAFADRSHNLLCPRLSRISTLEVKGTCLDRLIQSRNRVGHAVLEVATYTS